MTPVRIEWTVQALADLESIEDYIGPRSPAGARRVWKRIVARIETQAHIPFAAPVYRGGPARMLVVTNTPYLVFYTVVEDVLIVQAIMHHAQDR